MRVGTRDDCVRSFIDVADRLKQEHHAILDVLIGKALMGRQ